MAAVLPESKSAVLEDGLDAILPEPQMAEGEEFASLDEEDKPAPAAATPAQKPAAAPAAPAEDADLPEHLRGKSKAEIARMYAEAQSLIGRQGTELGEWRRRGDQLIHASLEGLRSRQQTPSAAPATPATAAPIDESAVFAKPVETISRLIAEHPAIKEIREAMGKSAETQAIERATRATERFNAAHPDAAQIMQDPEFRNWVAASPIRRDLITRAHNNFDFDAGDELFSTYKALKIAKAAQAAAADPAAADDAAARAAAQTLAKRRQQQREAATPTGGNASPTAGAGGKKIFRRADVMRLMEEDPDRYERMAPEIERAYAEGRVR